MTQTTKSAKILRAIVDSAERPGARLNIDTNKYEAYREVSDLLLQEATTILNEMNQ